MPLLRRVSLLAIYELSTTGADDPIDAFEAIKTLTSEHNIDHLDVVIANAGVAYTYPKVSELKVSDLQAHIETNVYGAVWLYQATLPLLLKSADAKFIAVGSTAGGLT